MSQSLSKQYLHIPLTALQPAKHLPAGAVLTYMAILHQAIMAGGGKGKMKREGLTLSYKNAKNMGLSVSSIKRGLERLESEGIIKTDRRKGRSPRVDLL